MDLALTVDQKTFASTTRSFLDKNNPVSSVRDLASAPESFDRSWWTKGAELGWAAMLVPEELGGGSISGEGVRDLAMIAEEHGRVVAPGALLPVNVVLAGLVEAAADDDGHTDEIEGLLAGQLLGTWAVYEPGAQWAPLAPATTALADGEGFVLDGVKDRVEIGEQADLLLVTAATAEGVSQFLVPTDTPGLTVTSSWSLDLSRRFAEVRLEGVRVPASAVVGRLGEAAPLIERQLQVALVLQVAELCGGLEQVFAFTTQWAFDRYSFGRPLASYQALKHRFADMKTWIEACQATSGEAARAVQDRSDDAAELVSVAKSYVASRAVEIIQDCVQMHGGLGVTWEHDLHLYLRRATVDRALYGTPEDHRRRIADIIKL
ncbi:acyl-CoA dehydrogenase family protein [Janibacter sp. G1551]|uniref:acyl-CoA dehydrogenase family protein n=1 Tax=Janibacter sp. G1551 TaxID=3420440 RepID=UPI003D033E0E